MPVITLPDGSQKSFDHPITVAELAAGIGAGLAKAALAGKVNGRLVDTSATLDHDAAVSIVTDKDPEGLEIIRHSTAHLLANAVQELFPGAQVTIGPVIEDGFYYDFAYKTPFSSDDLAAIEKRMAEIAGRDLKVHRRVLPREAAIEHFKQIGEHYKAEIIAAIPAGEQISLYGQGDWEDLCRGPHVPSTGKLKAFKLMKVAGAYWRGRFAQRDAAADLWHRVAEREAAEGILDPARGGREARSSPHRQGTRSLSPAGGGAGRGVLASEGLGALSAAHRLHAPAPERGRLCRGEHAGDHGSRAVGEVGSRREFRREHVHDRDAG